METTPLRVQLNINKDTITITTQTFSISQIKRELSAKHKCKPEQIKLEIESNPASYEGLLLAYSVNKD